MKYEWKKHAREFYLPKERTEIITVPGFKFFILEGRGNPNEKGFSQAVEVLYGLSYSVKMLPKRNIMPVGYFDYTVFPLEGVWDLAEEARELDRLDKNSLIYKIMIRQPDFVTDELAREVIDNQKIKKPNHLLDSVRFESMEEGLCVQMLHTGSYDDEPASFSKMEEFCAQNNLKRTYKTHREIYISDARKTQPDKLKTVLRFKVEHF